MSGDRLITVHNGIHDAHQRKQWPYRVDGPVHVGAVARLEKPKDPDLLIKAIAGLENVHLDFIGGGPLLDHCKSATEKLKLANMVTFWGLRRDVPDLMTHLDVYVLVSNSEGFPIATIEAMRAGLPTVVSDVGGAGEAVEDGVTGYLVPRGDVETLRDRLRRLVDDPDLRARMGRAARRKYEEEFTFERMYQKTLAVYEEVVAEHGTSQRRENVGAVTSL